MRRPLLTLCKRLTKIQMSRFTQICIVLFFISGTSLLNAQATLTADFNTICDLDGCDCVYEITICFDDDDPVYNGAYEFEIPSVIIPSTSGLFADPCFAAGESFFLVSVSADPLDPDVYCITGNMHAMTAGTVEINEVRDTDDNVIFPGLTETFMAPDCPSYQIMGDNDICQSELTGQVYTIDGVLAAGNTAGWSVSGGGTIVGATDGNSVTVDWTAATPGTYQLSFEGKDAYDNCDITHSIDVETYIIEDRLEIQGSTLVDCGSRHCYILAGISLPNDPMTSITWSTTNPALNVTDPVINAGGLSKAEICVDFLANPVLMPMETLTAMGTTFDGCDFTETIDIVLQADGTVYDVISLDTESPVCYGQSVELCFDADQDDTFPRDADATTLMWGTNGGTLTPVAPAAGETCVDLVVPAGVAAPNSVTVTLTGNYDGAASACGFGAELTIDFVDLSDDLTLEGEVNPTCESTQRYELTGIDAADLVLPLTWSFPAGISAPTMINATTYDVVWDGGFAGNFVEVSGVTMDGCEFSLRSDIFVEALSDAPIEGDTYVCAGETSCYTIDIADQLPAGANLSWRLLEQGGGANNVDTDTGDPTYPTNTALVSITEMGTSQVTVCLDFDETLTSSFDLEVFDNSVPAIACFGPNAILRDIQVVADPVSEQMACNNSVIISLNGLCELAISPDMVLEGNYAGGYDQFTLIIKDAETGVMVPDGVLDASFIGTTLEVMVRQDCTPNSCWGYITVEDKSVPTPPCPEDINNEAMLASGDFTVTTGAGDGTVDMASFDADGSIVLTSSNNGTEDDAQVCFMVPMDGRVSFDWDYVSDNSFACWDPFGYSIDGVVTQISEGNIDCDPFENGDIEQIGAECIDVLAGTEFCLIASTFDGIFGASTTTVTNFQLTDWIDCSDLNDVDPSALGFDDDVVITEVSDSEWTLENFDNCTDATLTYIDDVDDDAPFCDPGDPGSIVQRTWTVTDAFGNSASCTQEIYVKRPSALNLVWPPNWDSAIAGSNASLDACGDWPEDDNGNPHPDFTGYPDGLFCMNLSLIGYTDYKEIPKCGEGSPARKILRKWTVWDQCTAEDYEHTQIITLADVDPPVTNVISDRFDYPADPYNCSAQVDIDPTPGNGGIGELQVFGECSEVTIRAFYLPPVVGTALPALDVDFIEVPRNADGTFTIPAVDGQAVWVRYIIEDACFNGSTIAGMQLDDQGNPDPSDPRVAAFEIFFEDVTPPTPVCDLYTVVTLDDEGCAYAQASSIDDKSWDACGIDTMLIRRMDTNCGDYSDWGNLVKFCCTDLGAPVMVALGVWDEEGNFNECMAEVNVKDPDGPNFSCPADRDVDCGSYNLDNLSNFGSPSGDDNCNYDSELVSEVADLDECDLGTITRTWNILSNGEAVSQCVQVITVENQTPFSENANINWPGDEDVSCTEGTSPEDTGVPTYKGNLGCSDPFSSYDDLEFQYVDDACLKILRTWTVVDWCNNGASFTHTQVIKVLDGNGPSITNCQDETYEDVELDASCHLQIDDLTAGADDNCTDHLLWTVSIDIDNDGSYEVVDAPTNDASGLYPVGTHSIKFSVLDDCENSSSCEKLITIVDDKEPTPYCLEELVVVINPESECAEVWASDFDRGSFDGCDLNAPVTMAFSPNPSDRSMDVCCGELENGVVDTFSVQVYAIDAEGNSEFCTASLIVQDNSNVCEDAEVNLSRIAGEIYNEQDVDLENVEVHIEATLPEFPYSMITNDGSYAFEQLLNQEDYMVYPKKDDNYLNGVSTLDIVIIQRHILGLEDLDSPYRVIAADADNSETITAFDLVELRKLVLGIYEELPSNESWRFVREDFAFTNPAQPWPFDEEISISQLSQDENQNDFIAVKIGDVNFSAIMDVDGEEADTRSAGTIHLDIEDASYTAGEKIYIAMNVAEATDMIGFQSTVQFDASSLRFRSASSDVINIMNANINRLRSEEGLISLSWNDSQNISFAEGDALITLEFETIGTGNTFESIQFSDALLSTEAYVEENGHIDILHMDLNEGNTGSSFALYQNKPNPFNNNTIIGFNLEMDELVTLRVMDVNGKLVHKENAHYKRGYNEILLNTETINGSGVLYYQIDTKTNSAIRKMILIK